MSGLADQVGQVPVVETPRLLLHGHRQGDFAARAAMWADPIVVRHAGGVPLTANEAWLRMLTLIGHWSLLGFGYWAVEERGTGRFLGEVGFGDFKRDLGFDGAPEIGWMLASWAHGAGYATEAAHAAIAWGEARFGRVPTVCLIHPENAASLRVAARCGYAEYARTSFKGQPAVLLRRDPAMSVTT
jgi:RimJ/RimL family protein N-acetyltransferase